MDEIRNTRQGTLSQRLIEFAQKFCTKQEAYLTYVKFAREALNGLVEERIDNLRETGIVTDAHDALLNQLRGLRTRFSELDAIMRSLLLISEKPDEIVWEEIIGHINALQAIELEARSAQTRAALAAVIRDYVGGHALETRSIKLNVESFTAKQFHALTGQVREIQRRRFGREDTFTPEDLLSRLISMGSSNVEFLASLGAPSVLPPSCPIKR